MKHLAMVLVGSLGAACASHSAPPAASSNSVAQASDTPSNDPNFAPVASDGLAAAPADARSTDTRAAQNAPVTAPANGSPNAAAAANPAAANAAAMPAQNPSPASAPDNSAVNSRDKNGSTLTPMDQGNSEQDRKITQQIRQAVVKDHSLSFTAKNVKIITINGKVTLRGPVKSEAERSAIEAEAKSVAGANQVDNYLEIAK
jgi:hyperosmotically inducible protein